MNAKCLCQNCNGEYEFDLADFQETGRSGNMKFGQEIECPHCEKETLTYVEVGELIVKPQNAFTIQPPTLSKESEEPIYFNNGFIKVTRSRFIIGTQIFAMRSIESVKLGVLEELVKRDNIIPAISLMVLGLAIIGIGIAICGANGFEDSTILIMMGVIGFIPILIGSALFKQLKKSYTVMLKTGSGEITAYKSFEQIEIMQIIAALNEAIIGLCV